jgi:hypothetical protein
MVQISLIFFLIEASAHSAYIVRFFSIETGAPHPLASDPQPFSGSEFLSGLSGDHYVVGTHIYNWKKSAEKPVFVSMLLLFQRCCSLNSN